jgi:hypothetical protein
MTHLYINSRGEPVRRHSYSSGATWSKCKRLYKLERIDGYRRKDKSAALAFGKAIEDAVQFYHSNGLKPETGQDEFRRIWLLHKDNAELTYTAKEKDWANLRDCGVQLLRLYEILLPTFPIQEPVWQASYAKEVFPGSTLAGLEIGGFVDLISKAPWSHPLLPKVEIPKDSPYRPLLIDIKTGLLAMDQQLQTYAWLSGIPDVAFLWFTKGVASSFQKGTEVTLLAGPRVGERAVVYDCDSETQTLLLGSQENVDKVSAALAEIKGKGSTDIKNRVLVEFESEGALFPAPVDSVTKLKIQFLAVRIAPEDIKEAGEIIGRQIVEIHDAAQTGFYPKSGGVRFPNNQCVYCSHRGICLKDDRLKDELLVQIQTATDDWTEDIGGDE